MAAVLFLLVAYGTEPPAELGVPCPELQAGPESPERPRNARGTARNYVYWDHHVGNTLPRPPKAAHSWVFCKRKTLTPTQAATVIEHAMPGILSFPLLPSIDEATAKVLAEWPGSRIHLDGLETLEPMTLHQLNAKPLSLGVLQWSERHASLAQRSLILSRLQHFEGRWAPFHGQPVSLPRATRVDEAAIGKVISAPLVQNDALHLSIDAKSHRCSATTLTPEHVAAWGKVHNMTLTDVTTLDGPTAKALSGLAFLEFEAVTELSDPVARELVSGDLKSLTLSAFTSIPENTAAALAKGKLSLLVLNSVTVLTDAQATQLLPISRLRLKGLKKVPTLLLEHKANRPQNLTLTTPMADLAWVMNGTKQRRKTFDARAFESLTPEIIQALRSVPPKTTVSLPPLDNEQMQKLLPIFRTYDRPRLHLQLPDGVVWTNLDSLNPGYLEVTPNTEATDEQLKALSVWKGKVGVRMKHHVWPDEREELVETYGENIHFINGNDSEAIGGATCRSAMKSADAEALFEQHYAWTPADLPGKSVVLCVDTITLEMARSMKVHSLRLPFVEDIDEEALTALTKGAQWSLHAPVLRLDVSGARILAQHRGEVTLALENLNGPVLAELTGLKKLTLTGHTLSLELAQALPEDAAHILLPDLDDAAPEVGRLVLKKGAKSSSLKKKRWKFLPAPPLPTVPEGLPEHAVFVPLNSPLYSKELYMQINLFSEPRSEDTFVINAFTNDTGPDARTWTRSRGPGVIPTFKTGVEGKTMYVRIHRVDTENSGYWVTLADKTQRDGKTVFTPIALTRGIDEP